MGKKTAHSLTDWLEIVEVDVVDRTMISTNLQEGRDLSAFEGCHYVSDNSGPFAYFTREVDAYRFRLDYINRKMNP